MNALANKEVGTYINEHFVSSFQKVATFRIVGGQKQGGNVAAYFCAPDGRVLHIVAGPVDAETMLHEAKWVVETARKAIEDCKGDGARFKTLMRKAHAEKVRREQGLVIEAAEFDLEPQGDGALTYKDPSGRPLAPVLPPPPVQGPDVEFKDQQEAAAAKANAARLVDAKGRRWAVTTQGQVSMLMAAHGMAKIESLYGTIFENILGERISTKPVEIVDPFPWHRHKAEQLGK